MKEIKKININLIKVPKKYYRKHSQKEIEKLSKLIKKNGLLQPIIVKRLDDGFEIIEGKKRFFACSQNNLNEIDVIIVENDEDFDDFNLIEANQSSGLNPIEEALIYQRIINKENITQSELAKKLNLTQGTVANKIRLLKLPEFVKDLVVNNFLSERHARALLKVKDEDLENVCNKIIEKKYTVKATESYIERLYSKEIQKGYVGNVLIGINTIKEAFRQCKNLGMDCNINEVEYKNEIKLVIRFKK